MVTAHWIRCPGLTIGVLVDPSTGLIVDAPELVEQFIGQRLSRLLAWLEHFQIDDADLTGA